MKAFGRRSFPVFLLWFIGFIAAAVLIYFLVNVVKDRIMPAEKSIKEKYAVNLCLVTHDYAYAVSYHVNGAYNTIYLVKNKDNQFDFWEADSAGIKNSNRVYAAGLIIDSTGACITSKYVTQPWDNPKDVAALKDIFSKELEISPDEVTVDGLTVRMSIKPVNQIGNGTAVEILCRDFHDPELNDYDIAFIGPAERNGNFPFKEIKNGIRDNVSCYLLDFPQLDFSYNLPVTAQVTKLKPVDLNGPEGFNFKNTGQSFMEGAPVFNTDGNLVGVYTGFNMLLIVPQRMNDFISNVPYHDATETIHYIVHIDSLPEIPNDSFLHPKLTDMNDTASETEKIIKDIKKDSAMWNLLRQIHNN